MVETQVGPQVAIHHTGVPVWCTSILFNTYFDPTKWSCLNNSNWFECSYIYSVKHVCSYVVMKIYYSMVHHEVIFLKRSWECWIVVTIEGLCLEIHWSYPLQVSLYAKQKHLRCKKRYEANLKHHASRGRCDQKLWYQLRPRSYFIKNTFT